jgi:hypothetical protein
MGISKSGNLFKLATRVLALIDQTRMEIFRLRKFCQGKSQWKVYALFKLGLKNGKEKSTPP